MKLPDWVQKYMEPRTEIKRINNGLKFPTKIKELKDREK